METARQSEETYQHREDKVTCVASLIRLELELLLFQVISFLDISIIDPDSSQHRLLLLANHNPYEIRDEWIIWALIFVYERDDSLAIHGSFHNLANQAKPREVIRKKLHFNIQHLVYSDGGSFKCL